VPAVLELRDICKRFGAVQALSHVELDVYTGELSRWSATTAPASRCSSR
jgi:ABC-type sugar transport system ATPase subunit